MTSTKRLRRISHRRGAAAVELALVAPVVMLFAAALADYGRVVHAYLAVSNAARCGAAYGSVHSFTPYTRTSWEENLRAAVVDELANLAGFDSSAMQIVVETTDDPDALRRTAVTVKYPFRCVVAWPGLSTVGDLSYRVEMRQTQ